MTASERRVLRLLIARNRILWRDTVGRGRVRRTLYTLVNNHLAGYADVTGCYFATLGTVEACPDGHSPRAAK